MRPFALAEVLHSIVLKVRETLQGVSITEPEALCAYQKPHSP